MKEIAIIIPVYNPDEELIKVVRQLKENGFEHILVIDDGSDRLHQQPFIPIQQNCDILKNKVNEGKGVALKKGFSYILQQKVPIKAVVTVDADGQHKIEDIQEVAKQTLKIEEGIVLGTRNLKANTVPFRNKLGNTIASMCFQLKTKQKLEDTQTGLRGIPLQYIEELVAIVGKRYEYEMNVLKYYAKQGIMMYEVPIETVYKEKQKSHFAAIKDSLNIIMTLWR